MLRRQKAFTLIELMVVVSIIALLAAMLLPALQRALEQTRRASCMNNLKGAGTALALYSQNNDNAYPMLPGTAWDSTIDGTVWLSSVSIPTGIASDWTVKRSVSSLVFMLIRNGEAPKLFCCPSDGNAKADTQTTDTNNAGALNWDFSCGQTISGGAGSGTGTARNLSYSYACPIYGGAAPATDLNGIPTNADSGMVVMSDRTPQLSNNAASSGLASTKGAFSGADGSNAWVSTITSNKLPLYNSQNHTSGEMMNVLYVDGHVAVARTPNVGPTQNNDVVANAQLDCIFSVSTTHTVSSDGIDYGGTCDYTQHTGSRDTYLWGGAGR
jgi:prepilin-type N-terminal cleavage/methylation domain-containing protein/prepilin-type processing-associated H-X9-DG protein